MSRKSISDISRSLRQNEDSLQSLHKSQNSSYVSATADSYSLSDFSAVSRTKRQERSFAAPDPRNTSQVSRNADSYQIQRFYSYAALNYQTVYQRYQTMPKSTLQYPNEVVAKSHTSVSAANASSMSAASRDACPSPFSQIHASNADYDQASVTEVCGQQSSILASEPKSQASNRSSTLNRSGRSQASVKSDTQRVELPLPTGQRPSGSRSVLGKSLSQAESAVHSKVAEASQLSAYDEPELLSSRSTAAFANTLTEEQKKRATVIITDTLERIRQLQKQAGGNSVRDEQVSKSITLLQKQVDMLRRAQTYGCNREALLFGIFQIGKELIYK